MKSALLLIDIQNDYFPGGKMELVRAEQAGHQAKGLLDAARKKGIPVIHVQHLSTRPDAPFFIPDTPGVMIHDLVKPMPGEVVVQKNFPNSFRATNLQDVLTRAGIDHLFIGGMMTHMCVDATVRAAADLGYQCTLASDACATRDLVWEGRTIVADHVHGSFLAALSGLYAQVLPASVVTRQISE
ncbi:cysteine hydrolase family protein [uncultured Methanospirillum sp.]|uniref:cysteine hydrolase family protein n=1 Tax=uncultured Methanospirillum sp. TaxID=262503 RepID=UPI0029C99204|nr:cysteine hydrolase family protein [uncultured Methanospirillum sp.]